MIFTISFMYVSISMLDGVSFLRPGSLNIKQYTAINIRFTSAHVCLALQGDTGFSYGATADCRLN